MIKFIVALLTCLLLASCTQQQTQSSTEKEAGLAFDSATYTTSPWSYNDFWRALRRDFSLDKQVTHPLVQQQIQWYQTHPKYLVSLFKRSRPYLYYVANEAKKRDLPAEVVLLPMIESGYNPFAYSSAGAAGMWQIMSGTARTLGIKQSWWYDGRRDIYASTNGALNYLTRLRDYFNGNWTLAIAAYETGEGAMANSIKRGGAANQTDDFWSMRLPIERRLYVSRLFALAAIIDNPERYGIALPALENKPYIAAVDTGSQIDLARAARLADISLEEIYLLNPGYNRWATDPEGPYRLLIPATQLGKFKYHLANLSAQDRMNWQRYTVKKGDSLLLLAKRYHTTTAMIVTMNHLRGKWLKPGQTLVMPSAQNAMPQYAKALYAYNNRYSKSSSATPRPQKITYTMKDGDSLWKIAHRYQVSVAHLRTWNKLPNTVNVIKPGKQLVIWQNAPSTTTQHARVTPKKNTYCVKPGDNLSSIAQRYHVPIADLQRSNHLKTTALRDGQELTIPTLTHKASTSATQHGVKSAKPLDNATALHPREQPLKM